MLKPQGGGGGKGRAKLAAVSSAFGAGSSSDEEEGGAGAGSGGTARSNVQRAHPLIMAMTVKPVEDVAMSEADACVFDYDGAYDAMHQERGQIEAAARSSGSTFSAEAPKSQYIGNLKSMASVRERENDAIFEKKIAREQEAEEELGGPTERFVTQAYKLKLQEKEQWEEEERRAAELEDSMDVRKTGMTGFYSNLLKPPATATSVRTVVGVCAAMAGTTGSTSAGKGASPVSDGGVGSFGDGDEGYAAGGRSVYSISAASSAAAAAAVPATPIESKEERRPRELEEILFKGASRETFVVAAKQRFFERQRARQVAE